MPKKVVKKAVKKVASKTVKKVAAKKAPAKKSVARTSESALQTRYLHTETEDFYAQHPNVKPLIILFMLVATSAFIYLIKVRFATGSM